MKLSRIFALCMVMVLSLAGLASAAVINVSPMDVYDSMQRGDIRYLIDIRTPEEWRGGDYWDPRPGKGSNYTDGHPAYDGENGQFLEGRVLNISYELFSDTGRAPNPWFKWEFENRFAYVTEKPFVLMCASGKRSSFAAEALLNLGLDWDIYNMVGGFKGRDCCDSYCFDPFCIDGHCPGWKNFANGLPLFDPDGYPCEDAYNPVPIPGAIFLLGSGLIGIIGIRRKFMH